MPKPPTHPPPHPIQTQLLFHHLEKHGPDLSSWTLGEILELGGACVDGRGPFNVYCEEVGLLFLPTHPFTYPPTYLS